MCRELPNGRHPGNFPPKMTPVIGAESHDLKAHSYSRRLLQSAFCFSKHFYIATEIFSTVSVVFGGHRRSDNFAKSKGRTV